MVTSENFGQDFGGRCARHQLCDVPKDEVAVDDDARPVMKVHKEEEEHLHRGASGL